MLNVNALLVEQAKIVNGLAMTVPSSTTPDYVSLKGYDKLTILIKVKNATTVTGSAITLKQDDAVDGASEAALGFSWVWANIDLAAGDALVKTAVTNNTFTTDATNSKNLLYVIEVKPEDLTEGNDCVRVGTGDATAATVDVTYILWPAKYPKGTPLTAIAD